MRVIKATRGSARLNDEIAERAATITASSVLASSDGWERAAARGRELLAATD